MKKIVITGFDPFGGERKNPAYEAIKLMPDVIEGYEIVKVEIPTVFYKSVERVKAAIEKESPELVLCIGQAGGRFNITPEVVAINKNEARIPDNEGNQPSDEPVKADGKNAYFTSLPVKAIVKALKEKNIPAQLSYTAGTYVCNHVFYGLMYEIEKNYPAIRGGFIHVPFCSEQVLDKKNMPFMPLETIAKGLEIAIKASIMNKEDIKMSAGDTH